jgi:hypothetical protein
MKTTKIKNQFKTLNDYPINSNIVSLSYQYKNSYKTGGVFYQIKVETKDSFTHKLLLFPNKKTVLQWMNTSYNPDTNVFELPEFLFDLKMILSES